MNKLANLAAAIAVLSHAALAAETPAPRCLGAISSCIKIQGSLSMETNVGFVLDIEGSRSFVMSRHPPPRAISEIIGLDLSAKIDGVYTVCPMRHDINQFGHRHIYCMENFENLVVTPSGSAKPALCKTYTCKR
ncbi:MAG: hypothetical protein AB7I36_17550 [Rhodospirillaceae bacterium]